MPIIDPSNYEMKGNGHKPKQPDIRTDMSREDWNALADSKLQELLQTASGALLLAVIRESKDRIEGKSMQRIESAVVVATVDITAQREAAQQQALEYMQRLAKAKSISSITDQSEKAKDDKSIT